MNHSQFVAPPGKRIRLGNYDPGFTGEFENKEQAEASIQEDTANLAKYQDILLAHETYGVLMLFQAMDGAGKDGTIKLVMSSVDPQGCKVTMFEEPTRKELKQDYLRRSSAALPERGQIGIFNRSYYEQVLVERVHSDKLLDEQHLPPGAKGKNIWKRRYREINNFEQYLMDNGIVVLKFFLHLSKEKQIERLLERTELPEKKWKFSTSDLEEREHWDEYMKVYEDVFSHTGTRQAPWHIIPADHRWFSRAAVASITVSKLKSLHSRYPVTDAEQKREMARAQKVLRKQQKSSSA